MLLTMTKATLSLILSLVLTKVKSPLMKMKGNNATGIGIILNLKIQTKYIKKAKATQSWRHRCGARHWQLPSPTALDIFSPQSWCLASSERSSCCRAELADKLSISTAITHIANPPWASVSRDKCPQASTKP